MIKVAVVGSSGNMGSEAVKAVNNEPELSLVAQIDMGDDLATVLAQEKPDVAIDFTHPSCVKQNIETIITAGIHAVVGTTGLSTEDMNRLGDLAKEKGCGLALCPNFAIGAVLMMKYSAEIAKYMPKVEILECHHDRKADAPSGTALQTAHLIAKANPDINKDPIDEKELIPGSRGGRDKNIPIHSVRLEGFIASQEVMFGGLGQTLKLRHDTISRESFMPGVVLAVKKITAVTGLVYGLENLI